MEFNKAQFHQGGIQQGGNQPGGISVVEISRCGRLPTLESPPRQLAMIIADTRHVFKRRPVESLSAQLSLRCERPAALEPGAPTVQVMHRRLATGHRGNGNYRRQAERLEFI